LLRGGRLMADYRPLLIRAISRLDANTPAARQSVYANARATLEALMLLQDHVRIPGDEFDHERHALADAIAKVESRMPGGTARPAGSSVPSVTDGRTGVAKELSRATDAVAGHIEFINGVRDDTLAFRCLEHDPERRMEELAAIAATVSQEIKNRFR
jgi:hypothetical protein